MKGAVPSGVFLISVRLGFFQVAMSGCRVGRSAPSPVKVQTREDLYTGRFKQADNRPGRLAGHRRRHPAQKMHVAIDDQRLALLRDHFALDQLRRKSVRAPRRRPRVGGIVRIGRVAQQHAELFPLGSFWLISRMVRNMSA